MSVHTFEEVKIMKKLLAVLLAILCAFSAFSVSAVNTDELGDILGDHLGITSEKDEADILLTVSTMRWQCFPQ